MIQSMTGFGRASAVNDCYSIEAELSSLNSRFQEIGLRLPRALMYYQHPIRGLLKKGIRRGKLTLYISIHRAEEAPAKVDLDSAMAAAYRSAATRLAVALEIEDNLGTRELLGLEGVLAGSEESGENPELWELAGKAIRAALREFSADRKREGALILQDLETRLDRIESLFGELEATWTDSRSLRRKQLEERLTRLLESTELKPERFEMEIALLLDKQDISEEITRFRCHADLFRQTLKGDEPAGSKLGFILQEMIREANTISSKSPDAVLTHLVVQIKEEVERIREQVQNIE